MKERVQWIDVAKFLGIYAIYLGHFGTVAGNAYSFVFKYHVPLFFFISGCMNFYDKENNFFHYFIKKFKTIILPFWFFCAITLVFATLLDTISSWSDLKQSIIVIAKGNIRNSFIAGFLWFLTCLFLMEIIFKVLKYLKHRFLILAVCLAMYFVAEKIIVPRPIVQPHWYYNLDSVFYYIVFFAIGYIVYPLILKLFQLDTKCKRIIFFTTGIVSLAYTAITFFDISFVTFGFFHHIICALILIYANLVVAKLLENIAIFKEIGSNTLYLCGNEYLTRHLLPLLLGMVGLSQRISTPIAAYIYAFVYLMFGIRILIPIEKRLIKEITRFKESSSHVQYK